MVDTTFGDWIAKLHQIMRLTVEPSARKIGMSYRSLTGRVTLRLGYSVAFESSLEKDLLELLDFDLEVVKVTGQPFTLKFENAKGRLERYTPDFLIEYLSGEKIIFEVKYREDLKKQWQVMKPKFKAAIHYAKLSGHRFKIASEKEIRAGNLLNNAKFLRKYLSRTPDKATEITLLRTLRGIGETTPEGLLAASYWTADHRIEALPQLWRLLAERRIGVNLINPLTMSCPIWPQFDED